MDKATEQTFLCNMETYSRWLNSKGTHTKTIMRDHLISIRMIVTEKQKITGDSIHNFFKDVFLFLWKGYKKREEETEERRKEIESSMCWFTPLRAASARVKPGWTQEHLLSLAPGHRDPRFWDIFSHFQEYYHGTGLEAETWNQCPYGLQYHKGVTYPIT